VATTATPIDRRSNCHAVSLSEQKSQEQRLAMLNERTVIARELHDSLAQALSYLQIQVTLLQKTQEKQKYDKQQPIIDELKGGLSSAYRQLRELLTTFRLKIDAGGLKAALEHSVNDLGDRSPMNITLDYQLNDIPLSSSEEIHLLQIVREAGQNAIHHSQGSNVAICLKQSSNGSIALKITNDGVSIPNTPERTDHYGLAIMKERSRHLGGEIDIYPVKGGGTEVAFEFQPQCMLNAV
jgi:two-component system nitrate/nitrite sensor histidine kinase NarX